MPRKRRPRWPDPEAAAVLASGVGRDDERRSRNVITIRSAEGKSKVTSSRLANESADRAGAYVREQLSRPPDPPQPVQFGRNYNPAFGVPNTSTADVLRGLPEDVFHPRDPTYMSDAAYQRARGFSEDEDVFPWLGPIERAALAAEEAAEYDDVGEYNDEGGIDSYRTVSNWPEVVRAVQRALLPDWRAPAPTGTPPLPEAHAAYLRALRANHVDPSLIAVAEAMPSA